MATIGNLKIVLSADASPATRALQNMLAMTRSMGSGMTGALATVRSGFIALKERIQQSHASVLGIGRVFHELGSAVRITLGNFESWNWSTMIAGPTRFIGVIDRIRGALFGTHAPLRLTQKLLLDLLVPALRSAQVALTATGIAAHERFGKSLGRIATDLEKLGGAAGSFSKGFLFRLATAFRGGATAANATTSAIRTTTSAIAKVATGTVSGAASSAGRSALYELAPVVAAFGFIGAGAIAATAAVRGWFTETKKGKDVLDNLKNTGQAVINAIVSQLLRVGSALGFGGGFEQIDRLINAFDRGLLPTILRVIDTTGAGLARWAVTAQTAVLFFWNNWRAVFELVGVSSAYYLGSIAALFVHTFTETIPHYLRFVFEFWKVVLQNMGSATATFFGNLAKNLQALMTTIMIDFLNPKGRGFKGLEQLEWTPLFEGFHADALPFLEEFPERAAGPMEQALKNRMGDLAGKLGEKFAGELAQNLDKIPDAAPWAPPEKLKKLKESHSGPQNAGVALAGSAAALQSIALLSGAGDPKSKHAQMTAENTRKIREIEEKRFALETQKARDKPTIEGAPAILEFR